MILPHLKRHPLVRLRAVATATGLTARSVGERFGFEACHEGAESVLQDEGVDLVAIASRHDTHAELTAAALKAGKPVFLEKPVAIREEELAGLCESYRSSPSPFVMVGFNRRFAPLIEPLKSFLKDISEPLLLGYRVNAGIIPPDHWIQDREQGGGRILGETCHFLDLLTYLSGSSPVEIYATALPDGGRYKQDNLTVTVRFASGTVGTLHYISNGSSRLPKERLEAFGGGRSAVLDDFRRLELYSGNRTKTLKSSPDKGHGAEVQALIQAVTQGKPEPVPFEEAVIATQMTFAVLDSLSTGQPVPLIGMPASGAPDRP